MAQELQMCSCMVKETKSDKPTFQERFALIIGGSTLVAMGFMSRRPSFGGVAAATFGGLFLALGADWLRRDAGSAESEQEQKPDIVRECSEESFPASDPPSWVYGVK